MKRSIVFLCVIILSCSKAADNSLIEGNWLITKVEEADGIKTTEISNDTAIDFSMILDQLLLNDQLGVKGISINENSLHLLFKDGAEDSPTAYRIVSHAGNVWKIQAGGGTEVQNLEIEVDDNLAVLKTNTLKFNLKRN